MDKETKLKLFQEGLQSYVDALSAIRGLCAEVCSQSQSVLERNLNDLRGTLQRDIQPEWIQPYVSPNCVDKPDWDGMSAWVTAKVGVQDLCGIYAGLFWQARDGEEVEPRVCVDLEIYNRQIFHRVLEQLRGIAGDRVQSVPRWNELRIWEPISPTNAADFSDRLDRITKEWTTLLRQIPPEVFARP